MKLAIMQPYLFPYMGYFQLMNLVDTFVCYDDVNFINRGWINRNNILINGKANLFTIPLKEASQNKLINEIDLADDNKWKEKLLKTIEMSYKKAPEFLSVFPLIEAILFYSEKNLADYIHHSFIKINNYLGIDVNLIKSSAIYNNKELSGQYRILDICKQVKTDHYINPIGGMELYSKELFLNEGIMLNFIKSTKEEYKQFKNEFVPWLSIIDVLMFNDKVATLKLLSGNYELV